MDESVLSKLSYPEAKKLLRHLLVQKRISQLAEGNNAWLKLLDDDNRIHGRINSNGAITGRMSHYSPNMAQVPASRSVFGKECRELFISDRTQGKCLLGIDAKGLELRCLAAYMEFLDKGHYVTLICDENTDIHQFHADILKISRNTAKTLIYALIYGAGFKKLGIIVTEGTVNDDRLLIKQGKVVKKKIETKLPALAQLIKKVHAKAERAKHLVAVDGRILKCRTIHSSLNTLLQSAGAILMKQALVIFDNSLINKGFLPGIDYEFVANIHDEFQLEVDETKAEEIGQLGCKSIQLAGEAFNFKCPLDGTYNIGYNWNSTH